MIFLILMLSIFYGTTKRTYSQADTQSGLIIIDYESLLRKKGELIIVNSSQNEVGKFTSDSIILEENKYEIDKLRRTVFYEHFSALAFYPDYYIVVLRGNKIDKNRFEITLNGESVFIESKYASFQTVEDHLKNKSVYLTKKSPLKKDMDDSSEIISDYLDYSYVVIDIKGMWMRVKCDKEVYGLDFEGYVRWKVNDEITITVLYSY